MSPELDVKLVEKYPVLFRDRHKSPRETCMCWGFECGDGWYTLIDTLCTSIQYYVDQSRETRANVLRYNRALKRALAGDDKALVRYYATFSTSDQWGVTQVKRDIGIGKYRAVPPACAKVVVSQVKEKFGGLRFYYVGGDGVVDGMVRLAEYISLKFCEVCGANSASIVNDGGWYRSRCGECNDGTT